MKSRDSLRVDRMVERARRANEELFTAAAKRAEIERKLGVSREPPKLKPTFPIRIRSGH